MKAVFNGLHSFGCEKKCFFNENFRHQPSQCRLQMTNSVVQFCLLFLYIVYFLSTVYLKGVITSIINNEYTYLPYSNNMYIYLLRSPYQYLLTFKKIRFHFTNSTSTSCFQLK
jgi:hypothetical protein